MGLTRRYPCGKNFYSGKVFASSLVDHKLIEKRRIKYLLIRQMSQIDKGDKLSLAQVQTAAR